MRHAVHLCTNRRNEGFRSTDQSRFERGHPCCGTARRSKKKIGRFEIKNPLGAGAFGEVFRAHDPQLERDVALKVPHAAVLQNPKVAKRFLIEAQATARLTHPNIVPIFDAGQESGHHYIASAFIEGKTLDDALVDAFDFRQTARIVMKLADALAYAHEQGIIHRDIKPANIMLDQKSEPHLMDFGLARLETAAENLTHDGAILGTPTYMPPEQAAGDLEKVTAASDQYSLGVTLYEMLCGERPFSGPPELVIFNVINQEPPSPRSIKSDIPRDLETICQKAMAKTPKERYPSCQELVTDLRRWLDDIPISARRIRLRERFFRWCKRNPFIFGMVMLVLVAFIFGAVFAFRAELARQATLDARREAEAAYIPQVAHAYRMLEDNDIEMMNDVLSRCPARVRNWEWYYLRNRGQGQLGTLARWSQLSAEENAARSGAAFSAVATGVAFSRDKSRIAIGLHNGHVRIHDCTTGRLIRTIEANYRDGLYLTKGIALNSDGTRIAVAFADQSIGIWLTDSDELPHRLSSGDKHSGVSFSHTVFSPDGRFLISASTRSSKQVDKYRPRVRVINVETEKFVGTLAGHSAHISCLAIDARGSRFVTGSEDATLLVWKLQSEDAPIKLEGHTAKINCVVFSKDGDRIVSGGQDDTIRWWNPDSGEEIRRFQIRKKRPKLSIASLAFTPDGTRLIAGHRGVRSGFHMWDVVSGMELISLDESIPGGLFTVFVTPDGRRIATVDSFGDLHFWDAGDDWKMPKE